MGLAAIIIHEATIRPSVKNDRASRIFRLFKVERYRYVTKKFAELTIEEFKTRNTPINPISTLPIAVKRVRAENGVIIAHPGKTSFAFRSTAQTTESSFKYLR
jgi:hypothetical protein